MGQQRPYGRTEKRAARNLKKKKTLKERISVAGKINGQTPELYRVVREQGECRTESRAVRLATVGVCFGCRVQYLYFVDFLYLFLFSFCLLFSYDLLQWRVRYR